MAECADMVRDASGDAALRYSRQSLINRRAPTKICAVWASSRPRAGRHGCHPHLAYSVHHDITDHRYRLASWTGDRWLDREVASTPETDLTPENPVTPD